MSPKSNKSGVSYDERDPRSASSQGNAEQYGPRVVRARDFDAAVEGLQAERPPADPDDFVGDEMNESSVNEAEERRPDYGTWVKADLNAELDRREIEHDPKANNAVLIELLERSDGRETLSGVND